MTDSALIGSDHAVARSADARAFAVTVTSRFEEVEASWQELIARRTLESPGQSLAFTRLWADRLGVPERNRLLVVASYEGRPLALLPLMRKRIGPLSVATWFPGAHVGCNAPVADVPRLAALSPDERRALWREMARRIRADVLYLPAMLENPLFAELGTSVPGDTLYRAEFTSWDEADRLQRNKSRRKHDRQQGDKLEAMGAVTFEEIDGGASRLQVLETMFRQRAARFREMGVADPFADPRVRSFYDGTLDPASGVRVKLHVLRLDGEVIAVRYNIMSGNRLFCLISSMSTEPRLQPGSPGKQCLLRIMQTMFGASFRSFDMGAGLTDEKRHWCNVQIPLRQHFMALTPAGHAGMLALRLAQGARHAIKNNPRALAVAKRLRSAFARGRATEAAAPASAASEPAGD